VQQLLRERENSIPPEDSLEVAKRIKEMYSYVCPDIVKEFKKYEAEGDKWFKRAEFVHSITNKVCFSFLTQKALYGGCWI
jgi:actin-related protein 3